ncbi:hypothetical protein HY949_00435 [Candidatus Gottesmanbacteria bacterium]|nr:hypothetical protein [Candidatus Gottesmanbacteria bacterium]
MTELLQQCPVTGDLCFNIVCLDKPDCKEEANRILWLEPDEMEAEIRIAADRLGLDQELFAEFVYDEGLGAGSAGELHTDKPSPF